LETVAQKELTDSEAVERYLETRNSMYFSLLYERYAQKVYSRCISLLKDTALAQDAAQEVFVKIFLNLSKFTGRSKFSTWVYSITYNFCIDLIRKNKKQKSIFSDEMERAPDLAEEVPDHELLEMEVGRLKRVLEEIPVGDKAVLLMKYQEEMQIKEIAETLGKTESAIKMKIKRAKQKAKQAYGDLFPAL
jgi:RNA polymerase sigma factor (sigma-70 family)